MKTNQLLRPIVSSILLLSLVATVGVIGTSYLTGRSRALAQQTFASLSHLTNAYQSRGQAFMYLMLSVNARTKEEYEDYRDKINEFSKSSQDELDAYSQAITTEENRRLFERLMADREAYIQKRDTILAAATAGNNDIARHELATGLLPIYERYLSNGQRLVRFTSAEAEQRMETIGAISRWTQFSAVLSSLIIFLFGFCIGYTR